MRWPWCWCEPANVDVAEWLPVAHFTRHLLTAGPAGLTKPDHLNHDMTQAFFNENIKLPIIIKKWINCFLSYQKTTSIIKLSGETRVSFVCGLNLKYKDNKQTYSFTAALADKWWQWYPCIELEIWICWEDLSSQLCLNMKRSEARNFQESSEIGFKLGIAWVWSVMFMRQEVQCVSLFHGPGLVTCGWLPVVTSPDILTDTCHPLVTWPGSHWFITKLYNSRYYFKTVCEYPHEQGRLTIVTGVMDCFLTLPPDWGHWPPHHRGW